MSNWMKAAGEMMRQKAEKPPKGFLTRAQVYAEMNKSGGHADKILKTMIESGICERQVFKIETAGGVKPIPHFRLIKKDLERKARTKAD